MSKPGSPILGSALETGLYVLDPSELAEVDRELRARDREADPAPAVMIDPTNLPREVRLRVSAMVSKGAFEPPRLPEVALQVMATVDNPKACAEDLALLVHRDPFLAGRLLQAANSSMFRPRDRRITRLPEAVSRMGFRQVRSVVLAAAMEQSVYRGQRQQLMNELWQSAIGTAVGCRLVAQLTRRDPDNAFLLGLVHDVGKPVLAWCLDTVIREQVAGRVEFDDMAPYIFHLLHPRVGSLIVRHWKLPGGLARIVNHHHDPAPPDDVKSWTRMLRIADLLYECWRDSPRDFDEDGMLHGHSLLVRSIREPHTIQRLLSLYPTALETLLAG
jgi:HD-like signal output (HDOD) protein